MSFVRLLLAAAVAGLVLAVSAMAAATPKLTGTVGPGFTITLTKGGKKVTALKPGKYTFAVSDRSEDHNFHLRGPGVNKDSGVEAAGKRAWTVTLKKGSYTFVCDPHASSMKGRFTVK